MTEHKDDPMHYTSVVACARTSARVDVHNAWNGRRWTDEFPTTIFSHHWRYLGHFVIDVRWCCTAKKMFGFDQQPNFHLMTTQISLPGFTFVTSSTSAAHLQRNNHRGHECMGLPQALQRFKGQRYRVLILRHFML